MGFKKWSKQGGDVSGELSDSGRTNHFLTKWAGRRQAAVFVVAFVGLGTYLLVNSFAAASLAIDVKTSKHDTSQSTRITMTGFSTHQTNELLVAYIDSDGPGKSQGQYFKSVTGGNLTWRLAARSNIRYGTSEIWTAVASQALSSVTITATRAVDGYNGDMTVVGYTGADLTTNGATAVNHASSGAPTVSLTTTRNGSWVWATGNDWDSNTSRVVGSGQTLADQFVDSYSHDTYWSQYQTSPSAPGGTNVTLNDTSPTGDQWNMAAIEILPASTVSTSTPPSAPSSLTATASLNSAGTPQVGLTWGASTATNGSVVSYIVYRDGAKAGTSTSTSFTDTTVNPSTTYSYYVTAVDSSGNVSSPSNTASVTTPASGTTGGSGGGGGGGSGTWWKPPKQLTWYWQLQGTVNNTFPAAAYDIDGFDNSATEVASLHAAGKKAICYIDVGTWENWRSDASQFPASVLGSNNGWPGEKWLDVRQLSVLEPIMHARFQMCQQKGFDAVEADNIDGWENSTGFSISANNQLTYNEWFAQDVHALGMAIFQKNDPEQVSSALPGGQPFNTYFDGALDEQCNEYSECSSYQPYLTAGKPVLNAEYKSSLYPGFCSADNAAGIMGALFALNLDASTYKTCW